MVKVKIAKRFKAKTLIAKIKELFSLMGISLEYNK